MLAMMKAGVFSNCRLLRQAVDLGLLVAIFGASPAFALDQAAPSATAKPVSAGFPLGLAPRPRHVNFGKELASEAAHHVADWVVDANNNRSLPFVIVDKTDAKVYVFYADGRLRGAAPVLLGLAIGDDSVPGIGKRKLATILPQERTTPAGRFVAALDRNLHGKRMLWVDYEAAISLHPVITSNAQERRAERLATPSPLDNRISYGCINVPADFFKRVVGPAFTGNNGIVYVLPEIRSPQKVFGSYDVEERVRLQNASRGLPERVASQAEAKYK